MPNRSSDPAPGRVAIFYRRVSTEEQAISGLGLEAQLTACKAAAERLGATRVELFADEGLSAAKPIEKRPGLVAALANLTAGDFLVVAKRDRLARDVLMALMIERQVQKLGARIISAAGEGTDDDEPSNILMRRIIDAFNEYERLMIKVRTVAALVALRRRGLRIGNLAYGYTLGDDNKTLRASAEELAVAEEIADRVARGDTLRKIAADLDARGIMTKGGRPWSFQSVAAIAKRIRNPGAVQHAAEQQTAPTLAPEAHNLEPA
jgi:DNA invertase Pin-like site-specific DNA recombinase